MKIVLTGGGTAGHVMPNLALLPALKRAGATALYIGNPDGMEYGLCAKEDIPFYPCKSIKFDRVKWWKNLAIPFVLPSCIREAKHILQQTHPDAVFSKGGYVALPVILAAKKLHVPVVCHESDTTLGLANRIGAKFAAAMLVSDPDTPAPCKTICVGNPIRERIFHGNANIVRKRHNIPPDRRIVLVVGGSLGAMAINNTLVEALDTLCRTDTVIHICGKQFTPPTHDNYHAVAFVDDIENYYAAADVVVSRCGAGASGELTALHKRVVYIPLPSDRSRGDQIRNARQLADRRLAVVLPQNELTPVSLCVNIERARNMQLAECPYPRSTPDTIVAHIVRVVSNSDVKDTSKR